MKYQETGIEYVKVNYVGEDMVMNLNSRVLI